MRINKNENPFQQWKMWIINQLSIHWLTPSKQCNSKHGSTVCKTYTSQQIPYIRTVRPRTTTLNMIAQFVKRTRISKHLVYVLSKDGLLVANLRISCKEVFKDPCRNMVPNMFSLKLVISLAQLNMLNVRGIYGTVSLLCPFLVLYLSALRDRSTTENELSLVHNAIQYWKYHRTALARSLPLTKTIGQLPGLSHTAKPT